METVQPFIDSFINSVAEFGPKLLGAILAWIVGSWVIGIITGQIGKRLDKQNVDPTAIPYAKSTIGVLLKLALLISIAMILGIEATSFIAILGAAGLAIGLALQGSLANFAGGFLILVFKPFKVGDVIEAAGHVGVVKEIQIFNTILTSLDKKRIIIPNGKLANDVLVNFSSEELRTLVQTYGIGYGDDIDKAREVLQRLIDADERIFKDPAPQILVAELADSSVNFSVRMTLEGKDYWGVNFDMLEKVKKAFDEEGINIPYPQQDVHIVSQVNG